MQKATETKLIEANNDTLIVSVYNFITLVCNAGRRKLEVSSSRGVYNMKALHVRGKTRPKCTGETYRLCMKLKPNLDAACLKMVYIHV